MFLKSKKAFSLIELSIVLIIIGLLVAGVTSGASLIESARIRTVITEVRNYHQAYYAFYAKHYRLPGDLKNSGKIGYESEQTYVASNFPAPYNGTSSDYSVPDIYTAPFVELYLDGIIDFKPKKVSTNGLAYTAAQNGGIPISKVYNDYMYFNYYYPSGSSVATDFEYNLTGNMLRFEHISNTLDATRNYLMSAKIFQRIDEKFDDGTYNKGSLRSRCLGSAANGRNSYENATKCDVFNYKLKI